MPGGTASASRNSRSGSCRPQAPVRSPDPGGDRCRSPHGNQPRWQPLRRSPKCHGGGRPLLQVTCPRRRQAARRNPPADNSPVTSRGRWSQHRAGPPLHPAGPPARPVAEPAGGPGRSRRQGSPHRRVLPARRAGGVPAAAARRPSEQRRGLRGLRAALRAAAVGSGLAGVPRPGPSPALAPPRGGVARRGPGGPGARARGHGAFCGDRAHAACRGPGGPGARAGHSPRGGGSAPCAGPGRGRPGPPAAAPPEHPLLAQKRL
jgi:hypothetical protein